MKKFKDKSFAAKCNREIIKTGCDMLGMEVREVAECCIEGMKPYAAELGLPVPEKIKQVLAQIRKKGEEKSDEDKGY